MKKIIAQDVPLIIATQEIQSQINNAQFSFSSSGQEEVGMLFKILVNFEKGVDPRVTVIREAPESFPF